MPIFDVTLPANTEKVGTGAGVIRTDIKTVFTTLFENVVITVIGGVWECVQGWARIYTAVSGAPPVPAAAADDGRLWFVTDLKELRAHDGANWIRMSAPCDMYIPIYPGPGRRHTNAVYAEMDASPVFDAVTGVYVAAHPWGAPKGVPFTLANVPAGSTVKFVVTGVAEAAGQAKVKLYDNTLGADVAGSEVTLAAGAVKAEHVSADLTAAIAAGGHKFQLYGMAGTATWYDVISAELRIQKV